MRVAITGGVGEGKSTLLGMLSEMGHSTASADAVARSVFLDPEVNTQLAVLANVLPPIDSDTLRAALSGSVSIRKGVNALMHRRVREEMARLQATFFEIPLLIETGMQADFDRVWVVTCGEQEQRRRLLQRYADPTIVSALIATQLPSRVKIAFADRVFRTNQPLNPVRRIVSEAVSELWQ
jgi:dephospho-CoA kinase